MDFICAQPDKPLFIWQLQVLIHSLRKAGVDKGNIHFLMLLEGGAAPSREIRSLEKYARIFYYPERKEGRFYLASSKPYLFARHWESFPENRGRYYLFIESDMLVYRIPTLPEDENWYWSDASGYLETGRYEHLLGYKEVTGKAFGFHCYGTGADHHLWYKVEQESQLLYEKMLLQQVSGNRWICEMRVWMWNWHQRFSNIIHHELAFNDGKGPRIPGASLYHQLSTRNFRKREFMNGAPVDLKNLVHPAFSQYDYLAAIRATNFKAVKTGI